MIELAIRTAVILATAWGAVRFLRRASAATRHRVWHAAMLAVLLAPLAAPLAPTFTVPSVADAGWIVRRAAVATAMIAGDGLAVRAPLTASDDAAQLAEPAAPAAIDSPIAREWTNALTTAAVVVWGSGSAMFALWFVSGWIASARRARLAPPAPATWQLETERLRRHLGVAHPVDVKMLPDNTSPLVTGLVRSTILVPPAARAWSDERRQAVLLHELAHIRRGDCRVQLLSQAASALYWFNPLVWIAASALRAERERACDDEVLRHGARPSAYAAHLLEIAADLKPSLRPTAALAMARATELEGRLLAVLAVARPRVATRLSGWLVALSITAASGLALGATPGGAAAARGTPAPSTGGLAPTAFDGHSPDSREQDRRERAGAAAALETATDAAVRQRAALNLAAAGAHDAIPTLARALRDESPDVREKAALALGLQSSPAVVPALVDALGDRSAQVREKAALGLALRRDPRSVDALIAAIADPDAQVREKVAMALGTSGDRRATRAIETLLADRDPQVREKAAVALALVGSLEPNDATSEQARAGLRALVGGLLSLIR